MGTQVPPFDKPDNFGTILAEVSSNLFDAGLKWYTQQNILDALQDAYNLIFSLLTPVEHSTLFPELAQPYYNFGQSIADWMYLVGIYNPNTNLWLQGLTYQQFKSDFQTYLSIGEPRFFNIVDFKRVILWPYSPSAAGALYLIYKASAPTIQGLSDIPMLPYSVGSQLLQYFSTAQLFEQARQFGKAKTWWDKIYKIGKMQTKSIWDQAKDEIKSLSSMDHVNVLEPYRWIFHGGVYNLATWINNETPAGTINGVNPTFTLAQVPNPTSSLILTLNGQVLTQTFGYTLSGQTLTMLTNFIPQIGDVFTAWYQVS